MEAQPSGRTAQFVQLLTGCQSQLYAYICTLMGGSSRARDVLQETNLALWNHAADYDADRPFVPWAYRFAYLQVLAQRKQYARGRLVFDDELLGQVAAEFARQDGALDERFDALDGCLAKLPTDQRTIIERRYTHNESVNAIAAELGKAPNVVSALLYRIRKALHRCVESSLAPGGNA